MSEGKIRSNRISFHCQTLNVLELHSSRWMQKEQGGFRRVSVFAKLLGCPERVGFTGGAVNDFTGRFHSGAPKVM